MKTIPLLFLFIICAVITKGQDRSIVDSATANAIFQKAAVTFPKFYREYQYIKSNDKLIKRIILVKKDTPGGSPAFASPNGTISIDLDFLASPKPNFDDNRLIVVLYHELGHLHYYVNTPRAERSPNNSEQAAFEYSLLKTKEMAANGDCGPLTTGLKFMLLRSESNNLADPHVVALKRIVTEPLYADYVTYVGKHCK